METKRFFHLINGDVVFGNTESLNEHTVLITDPFTAKDGKVIPYMLDICMDKAKSIQIHMMNVLWTCPLDEFPQMNTVYIEATTGIIT